MPEQIKQVLEKVLDWWKKFNNKQRIIILSAIGVVIIALAILVAVMNIPHPQTLYICEDYKEASEIKKILEDGGISYSTDGDGLLFYVDKADMAEASILLGENEFPSMDYSIDNVVDGGLTTTESDKQKKWETYLEAKFADHIAQLSNVEACTVDITLPKNDGTILSREQEGTAAVTLTLRKSMDDETAYGLARYIATQLGNETTDGITILDSNANMIYSGADANTIIGASTSQINFREKLKVLKKEEIRELLVDSDLFSEVQISMELYVDFDTSKISKKELGIPEGMEIGALTSISEYSEESIGQTSGGVPGTDLNDGDNTTYVTGDGENTQLTIDESEKLYEYNEILTEIISNGGYTIHDKSHISLVANRYVVYNEAELKLTGQLDGTTFEEFKALHKDKVLLETDEQLVELISNATGIPEESISIISYEVPQFVPITEETRSVTDYLQIILAVLIFVLLGYVVFRSTRSQKEEEIQPELSVETLLQSTVEANEGLEDIGFNEKSDTRVMIEKFVDENPEAAASLLRNWLNEEWE